MSKFFFPAPFVSHNCGDRGMKACNLCDSINCLKRLSFRKKGTNTKPYDLGCLFKMQIDLYCEFFKWFRKGGGGCTENAIYRDTNCQAKGIFLIDPLYTILFDYYPKLDELVIAIHMNILNS